MASSTGGSFSLDGATLFTQSTLVLLLTTLTTCVIIWLLYSKDDSGPPSVPETIPFISNAYHFLMDMTRFMRRASKAFGDSDLVKFRLGPKRAYILRGQRNIQALFRPNPDIGSEGFMLLAMKKLWDMSPSDSLKYEKDKSGRLKTPNPGTESVRESERYWAGTHHLYSEFLTKAHHANNLAAKFYSLFNERLDRHQPADEWATVRILDFLKCHMAESATVSLDGAKILDLNPDFMDLYWAFDKVAVLLAFGTPRWLIPKAYRLREKYYATLFRYWESAWKNFDWDGPLVEADWEENFGSRFARELARWLRGRGFTDQTAAGMYAVILFGLNSNTVPTATWMLIYIIRDKSLLDAVRAEALQAIVVDPATGSRRTLDREKLVSLPLLQSIYTEVLRLHMSVALVRETVKPIILEGHYIPKGAFVQAMTGISHMEEAVWARDGHPASEFWAARHLSYKETKSQDGKIKLEPEFTLAGRTGAFFPFGGGTGMCPGRHFAKQEVFLAVAAIITRFDVEFVEWTDMDGAKSDREPRSDERYAGSAAMPPDRDIKVRWKRLW
ncbi:cytochrome P450 [Apodospora peruviana]|uniref:Cytochrome P450 n=1 Tax=Apodospora peruviana TaxID=516989 RepID=A0AAE0HSX5_9PEZI|nr:cytochrome P450 [Apodospora peruviana]